MAGVSRLPSRFPIGTHYVVEGVPGKDGELLITSRYVVLPNGTHVTLPVPTPRALASAVAGRRRRRNANAAVKVIAKRARSG
jgi:hypothetical protein